MTLYLAIDQGSHATRALAIGNNGRVASESFVEIHTSGVGTDRVEHDALEVAASVVTACQRLLDGLGADRERLCRAGLATQRSSIVCWDSVTGQPLSPVLSWRDRRAADAVDSLSDKAARITRLTGLVLSPHYGASKIRWCLDNLASVRNAADAGRLAVGPLSSFLTHRLVGGGRALVDPANASRTLLWDRRERRFSTELCKLFGVDPVLLPACVPSAGKFGDISIDGATCPLRVVTGDQSAALYAGGEPDPGVAYVNIGTGAFLQRCVGDRPLLIPGLLNSVVWQDAARVEYVVEGTVNGAASALHAFASGHSRDAHALVDGAINAAPLPGQLPVYLNAIGGLAAPYWLPHFCSEFVGDGDMLARTLAILESIAFLIAVNLRQSEIELSPATRIVVTGGMSQIDFLCQCLADVSATPVERSRDEEATSRGLAFLVAGRPADWPKPDIEKRFAPRADTPSLRRFATWQREMAARGATPPAPAS